MAHTNDTKKDHKEQKKQKKQKKLKMVETPNKEHGADGPTTNYVMNIVRCDEKTINLIKKYYLDDKGNFSFNRIIPMPAWLSMESAEPGTPAEIESWQDWSNNRWGTKYGDACETKFIPGEMPRLQFKTKGSTPVPIFAEMGRQLNCEMHILYADTDMNGNAGSIQVYANGKYSIHPMNNNPEFSAIVWGVE